MRYILIHYTQSDWFAESNLQISFRHGTLFASTNDRICNTPSAFGLQIYVHDTFGLQISISFKHAFGNLKADTQKFVILIIAELMSCSLPACLRKEASIPITHSCLNLLHKWQIIVHCHSLG